MQPHLKVGLALAAFAVVGGLLAGRVARILSQHRVPPPAMIVACAAMAAWADFLVLPDRVLAATFCLAWLLICLAAIDLYAFRLPDLLTFPLMATGLLAAAFLPGESILDHLAAALLGFAAFAGIAWLYHRLRGREGLGLGDAKLAAGAGAWLGMGALPSVLLVASLAGILWIGARAVIYGRDALSERVAFGAPLCFAIWLVWLYGPLQVPAISNYST